MSDGQPEVLKPLARMRTASAGEVQRGRVLLAAAGAVASTESASAYGVSLPTVRAWRSCFAAEGLTKLGKVRKGRGRKPSIPAEKVEAIVRQGCTPGRRARRTGAVVRWPRLKG